jgi:hypothetical protein
VEGHVSEDPPLQKLKRELNAETLNVQREEKQGDGGECLAGFRREQGEMQHECILLKIYII